jgi:hypothetical protein
MAIHNGNFTMTNKFSMLFNSLTSNEEKNAISYIQVALLKKYVTYLVNNFEIRDDLTYSAMKLS